MSGAEIIEGDALDVLSRLPPEHVDCCVTSPPYWGLRDYGAEGQIGLERTPEEYVERLVSVFREVRRVLKSDGTLWLNLGDCYATGAGSVGDAPGGGEQGARWRGDVDRIRDAKRGYRASRLPNGRGDQPAAARTKFVGPKSPPNRMPLAGLKPKDLLGMPWRVAFALQADGWWLRSDIVWAKPNPMPESILDRPTKAHEYVFLFARSERYYYDADAIREPHTSSVEIQAKRIGRDEGKAWCGTTEEARGEAHRASAPQDPAAVRERAARRKPNASANGRARAPEPGQPGAFHEKGRNKRSVWTIPTQPFPEAHFAVMPPALVKPCVLAGCRPGGLVLDPFTGSGTVGLVATDLGCRFLGAELNPEYAAMARRRLAASTSQGRLFG